MHDAGDRRGGRMASFFETIPERAQQGCQGFVAEDPAISDLCEQALGAAYREVGRRAEAAPASSEGAIQGLARTCLREAYEHSKVEGTGKTPGALFVEGLAKVVPCLDRQMAELEKRGEAGSSAEPPRG